MLPQLFLDRMKQMLEEEYPAFSKQLRRCALSGTADQSVKN